MYYVLFVIRTLLTLSPAGRAIQEKAGVRMKTRRKLQGINRNRSDAILRERHLFHALTTCRVTLEPNSFLKIKKGLELANAVQLALF